tara:strand:- start:455 stop:583 length:129 start_codon:yes stop_codon:yes gene_type:complete
MCHSLPQMNVPSIAQWMRRARKFFAAPSGMDIFGKKKRAEGL